MRRRRIKKRTPLLKEFSKKYAPRIADRIVNNPESFAEFMTHIHNKDYRVVQRIAWIASLVAKRRKNIVTPYVPVMIEKMQQFEPLVVKRHVVRALEFTDIPVEFHGIILDACFNFLNDDTERPGMRISSMNTLNNLATIHPHIGDELVTILLDQLEQGVSDAYRAKVNKILRKRKVPVPAKMN